MPISETNSTFVTVHVYIFPVRSLRVMRRAGVVEGLAGVRAANSAHLGWDGGRSLYASARGLAG